MIWARARTCGPHGFIISCMENAMKKLIMGFAAHHSGEMADNSPTFQRWEFYHNRVEVPKGRPMVPTVSRPFGTNSPRTPFPNVETLGYYRKSLRDRDLPGFCDSSQESNPGNVGLESPRSNLLPLLLVAA